MLSWKDYYLQEQIRQQRLEEAKQERLIRMLSRQKRIAEGRTTEQILQRIGYRLVEWGDYLLRQVADRSLAS